VLQHRLAKSLPLPLVLDTEEDAPAVGPREGTVGGYRSVAGAAAGRLFVAVFGVVGGEAHPLGECLEEGDLDGRALAGPLALLLRGKDARVGVHARR
jgi:hypothetical protein